MMFLIGWVDPSVPGYRTIKLDSAPYSIPSGSGYQRVTDAVYKLAVEINAEGWLAQVQSSGKVRLYGGSAMLDFADRLGWLLGFDFEPGEGYEAEVTSVTGEISPGIIPLYGADWSDIELRQEEDLRVDRQLRGHGYVWGSAFIQRWTLTMSAQAVEALQTGWCLRGKVTLSPPLVSGVGGYNVPASAIDGHVLGLESIEWTSDARTIANVTLLVSRESV